MGLDFPIYYEEPANPRAWGERARARAQLGFVDRRVDPSQMLFTLKDQFMKYNSQTLSTGRGWCHCESLHDVGCGHLLRPLLLKARLPLAREII